MNLVASSTTTSDEDGTGSGGHSLAGYEYQISVSIWLALDLVLVSARASEIVLEPASEEDLEAELEEYEPGRLVSRIPIGSYTLIVQVKRRTTDAWNVTSLRNLLKHGSAARPSAVKRLQDPKARYLLVTSAAVNHADARKMVVRRADVWPKNKALPVSIASLLPADAAGRIAVIANEDEERLWGDIDRLLVEGCRIPASRLEECRAVLVSEARNRVLGAHGGRWTRTDLEAVIRAHEGYLASSPELDHYVHPTNWDDLKAAMREKHAAIIIGQSGTGKTLATKQLYQELREEIHGLARKSIVHGPGELQSDATPPPVLYDLEDPWGRFDFDPDSRPWNDRLKLFLSSARSDRMIVVTTRLDVAQASSALDSVKSWLVPLETEHYGPHQRSRLYRTRIETLPRDLQTLAEQSERTVLGQLQSPLEIQKFFDALRTLDREGLKNPPGFIADAIAQAHQEAIEGTVLNQIEARDDVASAAILWGLLEASDKVTRSRLREIEDGLADRDAIGDRGVTPLVDFFIAARNLRQSEGGLISYYHPRVEKGIETTLNRHRPLVRRTLAKLVDVLTADDGPGSEWGAGVAARLIAAAKSDFAIRPSASSTALIDMWIEKQVANPDQPIRDTLRAAAAAGSRDSNIAELARFLLHRPDKRFGFERWGSPGHPAEWYDARKADPGTRPLVERFIRDVLPNARDDYPDNFPIELGKIADDLAPAFLDAARKAVHWGYIPTDDVIAAGALQDFDAFEEIVDTAVEVVTPSEAEKQRVAEQHLEIINGYYSDDYAQHLAEDDDGFTARAFLEAYVRQARRRDWKIVAGHRHVTRLAYYWFRELDSDEAPDADEFAAAFKQGYGTGDEHWLWSALLKYWDASYADALQQRIVEGPPRDSEESDALAAILTHAPDRFASAVGALNDSGDFNRLAEVAILLAGIRRRRPRDDGELADLAEKGVLALPATYRALSDVQALDDFALPDSARAELLAIADASEPVRALRLGLDAKGPLAVEDDVRWMLKETEDSNNAVLAIEAAIRHGMAEEVEAALGHRFADVVAEALKAIARPLAAPLPDPLLDLASNRGSPIRKALVQELKAKPHHRHLDTLMVLAGDTWTSDSGYYRSDLDLPIARDAVDALAALAPLPAAEAQRLLEIGTGSGDEDLRSKIFALLARTGGTPLQTQLFDLAVQPGSPSVRTAAADALLFEGRPVEQAVVDRITPGLVKTRAPRIASALALIAGDRLEVDKVKRLAKFLAQSTTRQSFVLLLALTLHDRDPAAAEEITKLLPAGHKAIPWALGGEIEAPSQKMLSDLGDSAACDEVLRIMRISAKQAG